MDAIVLAGGNASRLGGVDKAGLVVEGRTLLQRALDATAGATTTVVVGPTRSTGRAVTWTRETPPGGGPVAAIAAGLDRVTGELVAVIAVDLLNLEAPDLDELAAAAAGREGAILVDASGRDQPLAGVYRAEALRRVIRALPSTSGVAMHAVAGRLDLARLENDRAAQDCDTPRDLEEARASEQRR